MAQSKQKQRLPFVTDDAFYCDEEHWKEESTEDCVFEGSYYSGNDDANNNNELNLHPRLVEQDLSWKDHEFSYLLSKEQENRFDENLLLTNPSLAVARREAVEWMLRVNAHFSFSVLTSVLAVNYFDRFLFSFQFQSEKPWMTQLAAVACLSLAAKVEEIQVPLLLDLQVEEAKYVFEGKMIQRMEILVLSTLEWKMNPVTPHSFLDCITRRLGLGDHFYWEYLRRCQRVVLSIISDSRFMRYLASVIAAATMVHVANYFEPCMGVEYLNQLLSILDTDKDKVEECYQLILELASGGKILLSNKRKRVSLPGSPNAVMDVSFSSDSSNDSWAVASPSSPLPDPLFMKKRMADRIQRVMGAIDGLEAEMGSILSGSIGNADIQIKSSYLQQCISSPSVL
ncbi:hypothetical protein Nepgr_019642 [Nepenthes gracilis]|uniref:Uncharacterized protein n=1 Tax=Nepenthes gracilis TaxID=150966 RepID=A0AAD3SVN8_NEPGR|nr:hypothetical protein Nepgr_019642 [Nepenthes gracilis]